MSEFIVRLWLRQSHFVNHVRILVCEVDRLCILAYNANHSILVLTKDNAQNGTTFYRNQTFSISPERRIRGRYILTHTFMTQYSLT